jgi:hypothetical protein
MIWKGYGLRTQSCYWVNVLENDYLEDRDEEGKTTIK